jgi:hypothetical protein
MDDVSQKTAPAWLARSLELSKAQIEAGETVSIEPALDRLRASIARMEAKRIAAEQEQPPA